MTQFVCCFPPKKKSIHSQIHSQNLAFRWENLGKIWRPSSRLEDFQPWQEPMIVLLCRQEVVILLKRHWDPLGTWNSCFAAVEQYVLQIMYQCFRLAVYCACEVSLVVSPHFFQFFFNTCNLNLASPRQSLLVASVDSNSSDEHFLTPLHVACAEGNFDTWMVGCFQFLGRWNHETTNGFWHVVLVGWFQFLAFRIELDNPSRYRKSMGY